LQSSTVSLTLKDLGAIIKKGVKCSVCSTTDSVWVCLTCGQLNCGRYVNAHALKHFEKTKESGDKAHPVCLECNELSVFCYACDDFIVNDTNDTKLDRMRDVINKIQDERQQQSVTSSSLCSNDVDLEIRMASDESSKAAVETDSSRSQRATRRRRRTISASSSSSGISGNSVSNGIVMASSRSSSVSEENHRPAASKRAKTTSAASSPSPSPSSVGGKSSEQKQRLKHLVGLRNLGNTCFMSAVLQSLGNIQEFCSVLKHLPSLEDQLKSHHSSKNKDQRELRAKNGYSQQGDGGGSPIMTEELRKVLVALNQGHHQGHQREEGKPTLTLPKSNSSSSLTNKNVNAASSPITTIGGTASRKVISPEALFHVIWKVVPRFRGYQQQDAHEFLRYMLDRLHTELLSLLPDGISIKTSAKDSNLTEYFKQLRKNPMLTYTRRGGAASNKGGGGGSSSSHSLVTHIFGGTLQSEVTCLMCKASSKKHDPFLDLSIDIPSFLNNRNRAKQQQERDNSSSTTPSPSTSDEKPKCKLHDCLQNFVEVEELADSERFFCNNCKHKQRSTKKFWIRRLPNVLCLHLKRFRWSPYSRTKVDTHVEFPLTGLDMSPYLLSNLHETRCSNSGSSLYDLAAVIVHHGSGAGSGHYTAFVVKDSHWYHFNDSTVLATDQDTVTNSKAYILFYIQREFKTPKMSSSSSAAAST